MEILVQHDNNENNNETLEMLDETFLESVKKSFKKIEKAEGFIQCTGVVTILNRGGANFMSTTYKGRISGTTEEGPKELNLFLKHQIELSGVEIFKIDDVYMRELFMYRDFSDVINELQAEYNVPEAEKFKLTKCYDNNIKTIILDDLSTVGYSLPDRFDVISLEFAERAIEVLARFHSLSFVLREKRPYFFEKHIQPMQQVTQFNEDWDKVLIKMTEFTTKSLIGQEKKDKVRKFTKTATAKLGKYMNDSPSGTKVLCHGDYRLANMLVREKEGRITDLMPIDYQIVYYGCPVHDFIYLVFGATDRAFRRRHLRRLQCCYHAAMRRCLRHYRLDVDLHYPMKAFLQDFEERIDYGLITAIHFLPFFLASNDYSPDYAQDLNDWALQINHEVFDVRINEFVDEFMERGYL